MPINNTGLAVEINGKPVRGLKTNLTDLASLELLLDRVDSLNSCDGWGLGFSEDCVGWVLPKAIRCASCNYTRKKKAAGEDKIQKRTKHFQSKKSQNRNN